MARVRCTILEQKIKDKNGNMVDGVRAECMRCDHAVEAVGQGEKAIRRCLAEMNRSCPNEEGNFYVED